MFIYEPPHHDVDEIAKVPVFIVLTVPLNSMT